MEGCHSSVVAPSFHPSEMSRVFAMENLTDVNIPGIPLTSLFCDFFAQFYLKSNNFPWPQVAQTMWSPTPQIIESHFLDPLICAYPPYCSKTSFLMVPRDKFCTPQETWFATRPRESGRAPGSTTSTAPSTSPNLPARRGLHALMGWKDCPKDGWNYFLRPIYPNGCPPINFICHWEIKNMKTFTLYFC